MVTNMNTIQMTSRSQNNRKIMDCKPQLSTEKWDIDDDVAGKKMKSGPKVFQKRREGD